ncbi:hypothetical protein SAMN05444921_11882 [Streptomyces wuyuanensis]|uniref:Uncharacterized protein n=1 Tax=Streptomyces wuyuanensis TaxID=1196353 RepID=A0A1G9YCX3_9ACTN|nr:hypothetical protein SAMN05444921_11882 [Streptomyces wuyuanensis]
MAGQLSRQTVTFADVGPSLLVEGRLGVLVPGAAKDEHGPPQGETPVSLMRLRDYVCIYGSGLLGEPRSAAATAD